MRRIIDSMTSWPEGITISRMIRAYDEFVEFIAAGTTPQTVADFRPSEETKSRVTDLIYREKTSGLTADERSELDHYLQLEHIMRLAKARARALGGS